MIETPGGVIIVSTPKPVGTPGATLREAFGPSFVAWARPRLDATEFKKEPAQQDFKQLNDQRLDWEWNVSSSSSGIQGARIVILVQWRSIESNESREDEVWSAKFDIEIRKPFLTIGQIQLGTILSAVMTSGLSVPFLLGQWKEYQKKRAEENNRNKDT